MFEASISCLLRASLLPLVLIYCLLPPAGRAFLDIPCLFTTIFAIHCPGCGMKTAIVQLVELDWKAAVATNPLALPAFAALAWVSIHELTNFYSNRGVKRDRIFNHRTANDDERAIA
jgi:hypothetical protein